MSAPNSKVDGGDVTAQAFFRSMPSRSDQTDGNVTESISEGYPVPAMTNGWRIEALLLSKDRCLEFWDAYEQVIRRYLMTSADFRPLFDGVLNGHRMFSSDLLKIVAGMISGRHRSLLPKDFNSSVEIIVAKAKGRQSESRQRIQFARQLCIEVGFDLLARGHNPPASWWQRISLAFAKRNGQLPHDRTKLLMIRMLTPGGKSGRPCDPELETRRACLAEFVRRKISVGAKYEAAIEQVRDEIAGMPTASIYETRLIGCQTIRDAYDAER